MLLDLRFIKDLLLMCEGVTWFSTLFDVTNNPGILGFNPNQSQRNLKPWTVTLFDVFNNISEVPENSETGPMTERSGLYRSYRVPMKEE